METIYPSPLLIASSKCPPILDSEISLSVLPPTLYIAVQAGQSVSDLKQDFARPVSNRKV